MQVGSDERWGALAGIASVLLLIPALVVTVVSGDLPAPDAPTARVVRYLVRHRDIYLSSLFFEIISLALLVWFVVVLMGSLGRTPPASSLGHLAVAGVVGFAILMLIEDAAFAAAARLADQPALAPTVRGLWEFGYQAAWPFSRGFLTLLLAAAAVAIVRGKELPARLAATAVVAGVVNLAFLPTLFERHGAYQAGGVLAHATASLAFELWILEASIWLLIRASRSATKAER